MVLHHPADFVDIALRLIVLYLQVLQLVGALLEKAQESLFLFLIVEVLQLGDHVRQHLANLAHVLGAHIVQGALGEVRDLLLAAGAVLQHHLGIRNVDLGGKIVHHLLFRRGQHRLRYLLRGLGRRRHFRGLRLGKGLEGQGGALAQHFI